MERAPLWPAIRCDVFCVRHGQSDANVANELVGRRDPPLTNRGRRQAADAATYLNAVLDRPAVVVSSPLRRAKATADAIEATVGLSRGLSLDDRLMELDYGDLEGTPFVDLLPDWPPPWIADHTVACPGGEPIGTLTERVLVAVGEHAESAAALNAALIVVTHLGPIKALVGAVTGDPVAAQTHVNVSQGSLTSIRLDGGHAKLTALNLVLP